MNKVTSELVQPYKELEVLKENKYKKVTLNEDASGTPFVKKAFRGHEAKFSVINAQYAHDVLHFFFENFKGVATIPRALGVDLTDYSVQIEYLPELPGAEVLTQKTLYNADNFFRTCYGITEDHSLLRPIEQSLLYNEKMQAWVSAGKPMSLGLKGDLWQNLCLTSRNLIIADIDSAGMEPLGMSEIVVHSEIHAELSSRNLFNKLFVKTPTPICFSMLSASDSRCLLELALDYISIRMYRLPKWLREAKITHIRSVMSSLIECK